jgi:acyl-coenzyme A synthetase/AMP-(fatty) acid ligase
MFTSGTTGEPKRIPMTVRNIERAQETLLQSWNGPQGTTPGLRTGVVVLPVPIVHSSGLANALGAILAGRRLVLMERFEVDEWVRLVEEYEPKTAGLPPTALRMIFDRGVEPRRLASLKTIRCGTAPLDPEFQRAFEERFGVPIITVYGATEFAGGLPLGWTLPLYEEWKSTVRDVLATHPDVAEAAVVALADERLGQVPAGAVVLREGATIGEQELIEWARERLSPYQVPVRIAVLDAMPRTPALKVNTREVVGMLQDLGSA